VPSGSKCRAHAPDAFCTAAVVVPDDGARLAAVTRLVKTPRRAGVRRRGLLLASGCASLATAVGPARTIRAVR
jgi:hypothetical protein